MYKTVQGQTWDNIAKEVYGNEMHAGELMAANPQLLNTFIFSEGVIVQVPEIDTQDLTLPPWRR